MFKRFVLPRLALAAALALVVAYAWTATQEPPEAPEVSPAAAALLNLVNTGPERALHSTPGLGPETVARILAHRASGGKFKNVLELRIVTRMSEKEIEDALQPFQDAENIKAAEALRKPVPEPPASGKSSGRLQRGDKPTAGSQPAPVPNQASADPAGGLIVKVTGEGPITNFRPGFYGKLPGYEDLDKIDPLKRTEFLETVNREMCTCGCGNETLAFCLVNDRYCSVIKARVKKVYDDIMNKPR